MILYAFFHLFSFQKFMDSVRLYLSDMVHDFKPKSSWFTVLQVFGVTFRSAVILLFDVESFATLVLRTLMSAFHFLLTILDTPGVILLMPILLSMSMILLIVQRVRKGTAARVGMNFGLICARNILNKWVCIKS